MIEMWDAQDGFFYDVLRLPNGDCRRLKVCSMMGLLPLCASTVVEATGVLARHPRLLETEGCGATDCGEWVS